MPGAKEAESTGGVAGGNSVTSAGGRVHETGHGRSVGSGPDIGSESSGENLRNVAEEGIDVAATAASEVAPSGRSTDGASVEPEDHQYGGFVEDSPAEGGP